jgi:hypothetical protein
MSAFAAAEQNGKADELERELVSLFTAQNTSPNGSCLMRSTFMLVTVQV